MKLNWKSSLPLKIQYLNTLGSVSYLELSKGDTICVRGMVTSLLYWREYIHVFIGFASSKFTLRSIDSKVVLAWV